MSSTPRLQLPLLSTGQAQKEATVNESFQIFDVVAAGAVEEAPRDDPPASPVLGNCYIIGSAPSGDWSGKAQFVAAFTSGGWRLLPPTEGMAFTVKPSGYSANYRAGAWEIGTIRGSSLMVDGQQVVGSQGISIADPAGGSTIDAEARAAVAEMLAAMREHGLIAT